MGFARGKSLSQSEQRRSDNHREDQAKLEKYAYGHALAALYIALGAEKAGDQNVKYLYPYSLRVAEKAGINLFISRSYFQFGRFALANGDVDTGIKNLQASLDLTEAELKKIT